MWKREGKSIQARRCSGEGEATWAMGGEVDTCVCVAGCDVYACVCAACCDEYACVCAACERMWVSIYECAGGERASSL